MVATPIGNLEDITLRALRILKEVSLIAAEDTRHTARLLRHYGISTRTISYYEHNKLVREEEILRALEEGDVAIVSDAGTPGLSDPGLELVQAAIGRGFEVTSVPGPSAVIAALVISGLPTDQFVYLGFLPRKRSERRSVLRGLASERRTVVFYEAPHRVLETLADILDVLGDRRISVSRELTKIHEEVRRETVGEALAHFTAEAPRGEFTIVLEGSRAMPVPPGQEQVSGLLLRLREQGIPASEAVRQVAQETGMPRRQVYRIWTDMTRAEQTEG